MSDLFQKIKKYLRRDTDGSIGMGRSFGNRTFERKQGCYNCVSWDNGPNAEKHYNICRNRDARVMLEKGATFEDVDATLKNQDNLARPPKTGLCMKGASGSDFVAFNYLCERWTGKVHVDGGYDATPEELRDKLGESNVKKEEG